ncbi:hypothetical protein GCM10020000_52290 [Streptomyces olivoverticillatus]
MGQFGGQPQQPGVDLAPQRAERGARAVVDEAVGVVAGQGQGIEDERAVPGAGPGEGGEPPEHGLGGPGHVGYVPYGGHLGEDGLRVQQAQCEAARTPWKAPAASAGSRSRAQAP